MVKVPVEAIEEAIRLVGFYHVKARTVLECCQALLDRHGGQVPNDLETLLALPGVGRKTANLVLTEGFGLPGICVDTHVHRISNRWGYVETNTPEETEMVLRSKLPQHHWIRYNYLLVAFGQNLCRPQSPHCSRCTLQPFCPALGVERKR
jgi:endonuclease-3